MGKLTDVLIEGIKPTGKVQKIYDGGGLHLFVPLTGVKLWRIDYRFEGKRKLMALGAYPVVTLAEAREILLKVKQKLKADIDPMAERKAIKESMRKTVDESIRKAVDDAVKEIIDDAVKESVKKAVNAVVKKITEEIIRRETGAA